MTHSEGVAHLCKNSLAVRVHNSSHTRREYEELNVSALIVPHSTFFWHMLRAQSRKGYLAETQKCCWALCSSASM